METDLHSPGDGSGAVLPLDRLRSSWMLDGLIAGLFWIYLLLLPLAHWLAPSGWLPLPNVPLMLAAVLCVITKTGSFRVGWRDVAFAMLATVAVLSTLLNGDTMSEKSLNHVAALLFVTVLNYLVGGRIVFSALGARWKTPLLIGFLFACAICVIEFILVNFMGLPLPGFRPYGQEYDSTFLLGVRPRSTFYESGHFAFYLACMLPLLVAAYVERGRRVIVRVILAAFAICAVLLFSTSLFLVIVLWGLVYLFMARVYVRPAGLLLVLVLAVATYFYWDEFVYAADVLFLHKFQLYSFDDRQEKFLAVLNLVKESSTLNVLFGYGMGSFAGLGMADSISSYANFLRDVGLVGLALFVATLLPLESLNQGIPRVWQTAFLYMGVALLFFFGAVPNYYFPHLAFALGVMSSANDPGLIFGLRDVNEKVA